MEKGEEAMEKIVFPSRISEVIMPEWNKHSHEGLF
jgi:hypothetical protein